MNGLNKRVLFAVLIVIMSGFTALYAAEPVLIVNTGNSTTELTASEISKIYTGKMSTWSASGGKIVPVDQNLNSEIAGQFLKDYLKKSNSEYKSMWMSKMLSGAGSAPKALANDAAVIDFVAANSGAVGYIDKASLTGAVKEIQIK